MKNRTLPWMRLISGLIALFLSLCAAPAHAQTAPLSVSFSGAPDPAMPGDTVVYKIVLANPSTTTATGAFTLNVSPPQYATVGYSNGASCTAYPCRFGNTLYWNVISIAPGASTLLEFFVTIDNSVANPPPTLGTVLSASLNATVATKAITALAGITIGAHTMNLAIKGAPNRVTPGGLLTYTASYGNAAPGATATSMVFTVPTGTTFVSATGGGLLSGGTVQWDLGTVAPGFSDQRQFTVKVADSAVPGSLLVAQAQLLNSGNQQSLVREVSTSLVASSSPLTVSLVGSPDPAAPGGTVIFKLFVSNNSTNTPTGAYGINVNMPRFATINANYGGACQAYPCRFGSLLYWNMPTLAPGASTFVQFSAQVDNSSTNPPPPDGTILFSDATVYAFGGVTASGTVVVDSTNRLNLALSTTSNEVIPGALLTYTLTYGNAGTGSVPASMSATIPAGATFVSGSGGAVLNGNVVQWNLGTVAAGFYDQRQLVVKVADSAAVGAILFAEAQLLNASNQRSLVRESKTSFVTGPPLLSMSLTGTPDPIAPGGTIIYKIMISNRSTNTPTGTYAVDVNMPRYATTTANYGGSCTAYPCRFGGVLYWNMPTLAPGASTFLQFSASVDNSATNPPPPDGTILFSDANASAFGGVSATSTILVDSASRLSLALSGTPSRIAPSGTLTYTLHAGNYGTKGVPSILSMTLPTGVSFISATAGGVLNSGSAEWALGTFDSGVIYRRQVVVKVDDAAAVGASLVALAQILEPTARRTLKRESTTTLVANDALLSLAMTATPSIVAPGGTAVFTLNIANRSANTPTGGFEVDANVPNSATVTQFGSAACTSYPCRFGNILYWNVPSIPAGGSATLQFSVVVDNTVTNPAPANGTVLTSSASASVFGGTQTGASIFVNATRNSDPAPAAGVAGGTAGNAAAGGGGTGGVLSSGSGGTGGNAAGGVGGDPAASDPGTGTSGNAGNTASGGSEPAPTDLAGAGGEAGEPESEQGGSTGTAHGGATGKAGAPAAAAGNAGTGAGTQTSEGTKSGGCTFATGRSSPANAAWVVFGLIGLGCAARKRRRQRADA